MKIYAINFFSNLLLLSSIITFIGCDETTSSIVQQFYSLNGIVVTEEEEAPLDSVMVGFKDSGIPDSLIFINDSLVIAYTDWIDYQTLTEGGLFNFSFQY